MGPKIHQVGAQNPLSWRSKSSKIGNNEIITSSIAVEKRSILSFVNCGKILPSFELSIRDDDGNELGDYICGRICLRGDSVMSGYFQNKDATEEVLDEHGLLDTGDIGFRIFDK